MSSESKKYWEYFFIALAALSSVVTLLGFIFESDINWKDISLCVKFIILILIIFGCMFYACLMTSRKSKITFKFNPQFILTIEEGDLFDKKGIIVIPVNEYFDTHIGDGIISSNSIHGKFVNSIFKDRIDELNTIITDALKNRPCEYNASRQKGNKQKYELGTCIDVKEGDNIYVLVALTHFDKDNHAYLERKDFPIVFDKLIFHLNDISMQVEKSIYMPLMGTGLSRLKRSPQRILNFLVDAIDFKYSGDTFPYGFFVEIYDVNQVNLNQLENHFENDLSL